MEVNAVLTVPPIEHKWVSLLIHPHALKL